MGEDHAHGRVDATWEKLKGWFDAGVACVGMGSNLVRKDMVAAEDWEGIKALTSQCLAWIRKARGQALYRGVEHVGLYPTSEASAEEIVDWYPQAFDLKVKEGRSSFVLSSDGFGRIEVSRASRTVLAISPCRWPTLRLQWRTYERKASNFSNRKSNPRRNQSISRTPVQRAIQRTCFGSPSPTG